MSVDFGCIEICIFPDFENYVEPFEDYLDYLLVDKNEEIQDPDEMKFGNHQKFIHLYVKFKQKCLIK